MYDNEMMRIQMNKNIDKANINGGRFLLNLGLTKNLY